jgi:hypothetical protein
MNRAAYYDLRRSARAAQRTWWLTLKDPHSSPIHRASAMDNANDAVRRVPGGVSFPVVPPVMLPGWYARRSLVFAEIRERRARIKISSALSRMAEQFAPAEIRAAA